MTSVQRGEQTRERILMFIVDFLTNKGYTPTVREICEGTGLSSTATVHCQLTKMEKLGMIKFGQYGTPRTLTVPGYKFVKENEPKEAATSSGSGN